MAKQVSTTGTGTEPKTSGIDLATLDRATLARLIADAGQLIKDREREDLARVRDDVLTLLADRGFTFDEVFPPGGVKKSREPSQTRSGGRRVPRGEPRFANPADASDTWSGRGRRPEWFTAHVEAGGNPDDLRIAQ